MGLEYGVESGLGSTDIRITIAQIIRSLMGLLAIIFIILILVSGFYFLISQDDPEKKLKAKKILLSAIIGLIVIVTAYAIVSYIVSRFSQSTGISSAENSHSPNQVDEVSDESPSTPPEETPAESPSPLGYIQGDADGDGIVEQSDYVLMNNYLSGSATNCYHNNNAIDCGIVLDLDENDLIDVNDLNVLLQLLGLTPLVELFSNSAGPSVPDAAFYTQENGGVDDFNNGTISTSRFSTSWISCTAENNYCGTNDSVNAEVKDANTSLVWSKWLDNGTGHNWFWANNCYQPGTTENPGTCASNGDDACRCVKIVNDKTGCEGLGAAWRLPYQKEYMQAYIDGSWGNFTNARNTYWSATTYSPITYQAWGMWPNCGFTYTYNKSSNAYKVRCVLVSGTPLDNTFNGSAGPNVSDSAFYTQDKGGVDDYNNGGLRPADSFSGLWTDCNAGNNYCTTNDSINTDKKDFRTDSVWSKWLDNGTGHNWFWANNCYQPGTTENPGTCVLNGDDACRCVKIVNDKTGCEGLGAGWRLPYQKEFMQAYIDGVWGNLSNANRYYWLSTSASTWTASAYWDWLGSNMMSYYYKTSIYKVRCIFRP